MTRFSMLVALAVGLSTAVGCGARVDPEAERRRQEERAAEHRTAFAQGMAHLEASEHEAAIAAFEKAHALSPTDTDTSDMLGRARAAKQRRDTERYEKAMTAGRDAETAGKHRAARAAFADALRWKPNDPDATAAHGRAEIPALAEQGREQFDAKQYADATRTLLDATRKSPANAAVREQFKRAQDARRAEVRDEYEKAMAAGRVAMGAKSYAAAVGSFEAAERLVPGDEVAAAERQEARRAEIRFEYDKAMAAGRTAMAEKNYVAASRSFAAAEKLVPGDKAAFAEKLTADFENHVRRGQDARAANRPVEAITEFEAAARLKPQDEHTRSLLAAARQAKVDADRARYAQAVGEAKSAMLARRYRDAVRLAKQAEGVVSDNGEAAQIRRDAERAISEYDLWIAKAKTAIQKKKYDDAVVAADEAARLMPGETEPVLLRSEAVRKKLERK